MKFDSLYNIIKQKFLKNMKVNYYYTIFYLTKENKGSKILLKDLDNLLKKFFYLM